MSIRTLRTSGIVDRLKRLAVTFSVAALIFLIGPTFDLKSVSFATQTPAQIAARITALTGLNPDEIDQIYAAEQEANVLIIASEVAIPIVLENRIGYLLIRRVATGEWIRMIVPTTAEWDTDFRPYLESQGVTIHRQPYGTIDAMTPAAEAAAIAASGSIPGSAIANLVLYGDVSGPAGTIPAAPSPAGPSIPSLASYPGLDTLGTTAGNFRVDETGSATYSVPLITAAGTAGVAPQVSLNYSSAAGNGIAGLGWSIGGLSAISRCRQTYDQDRNVTAVNFTSSDQFCLDGQRLLVTSGSHGNVGATYRTEIDSGAIVTIGAVVNNEPDYFKVERKDGSTSYYGKAPGDADVSAKLGDGPGRTYTWAVRVFSDSVNPNANDIGNPIWFFYETSGGGQRVSEIRWAYGSGRGPTGHGAHVEFDYGTTPRADTLSGYIDGALFFNDKRLEEVRSYNAGVLIREYELEYQNGISGYDNLSRLLSIEECLGAVCLPKTMFDWRNPYTGSAVYSLSTFTMSNDIAGFLPIDINGDGRLDLVWTRGAASARKMRFALSTDTGYVNKAFSGGGFELSVRAAELRVIDYNLDGRHDVIYYDDTAGRWKVVLAEPHGNAEWRLLSTPITTPLIERYTAFADIDSNGTADAVYSPTTASELLYVRYLKLDPNQPESSAWRYHFGDEEPVSVPGNGQTLGDVSDLSPDFNGDGQVDIVMRGEYETECDPIDEPCEWAINHYALTLSGVNQASPSATAFYDIPTDLTVDTIDLNSDGLNDLFYRDTGGGANYSILLNKGDGTFANGTFVNPETHAYNNNRFVDWNMDGYADLIWRESVGGSSTRIKVRYWQPAPSGSVGGFGPVNDVATLTGWSTNESILFIDVNGDAATDIVRLNKNGTPGSVEVLTRKLGLSGQGDIANVAVNRIERVTNGLGAATFVRYEPLSTSAHYERLELATSTSVGTFCEDFGVPPDVETICFDEPVYVTDKAGFYETLNGDWGYPSSWQTLGKNSPVLEMSGPFYVVTDVTGDAPAAGPQPGGVLPGATSTIEYHYREGKLQAAGRGFLGFQRLLTVDKQSDIVSTTSYRQDWPFMGMPMSTQVVATDGSGFGGDTISTSSNEWEIVGWDGTEVATAAGSGTAALGPLQAVQSRSTDKTYDLVVAGSLLSEVSTASVHNDEGYPTSITVETHDLDGMLKKVTTLNEYNSPGFTDFEGRLSRTVVDTEYTTGAGTVTAKLVTTFGYHGGSVKRGLLETETIDPGPGTPPGQTAPPSVTTTHDYDAFGNRVKSSVASGGETRCNVETAVYDSTGRYVDTTRDCLGRTISTVQSRNSYGSPTSVRTYLDTSAVSHATTTTAYSVLGRRYYEHTSDGASITTYPTDTLTNCPVGTVIKTVTQLADGSESQACSDRLGRETRMLTRGFDGAWDAQDTEYDDAGRVVHKSEPYDVGANAIWTLIAYDQLGRPTTTTLPDNSSSTTSYTYVAGADPLFAPGRPSFMTTVTNDAGRVHREITNAMGETTAVIDHLNGRTSFVYDALGNLASVIDPGGKVSTMTYDVLGRKRTMDDPNKGQWTYEYNGFGEVIQQTDARSQVQVMDYDGLGRMICRRDESTTPVPSCSGSISGLEGAATWVYDTAANGLGQLASVSDAISNYQKVFNYDNVGRLSEVYTTIDGVTYSEKTTYDSVGRVYQVFDAAGDGSYTDQGVVHYYNSHGYLSLVGDAVEVSGSPRTIYRQITAMNARGQVEVETLGDGVISTNYDYYDLTGRMWKIQTTAAATMYDVQDLEYHWDTLGNLNYRKEMSGSKNLTENFTYDALNRLETHQVSGEAQVAIGYEANGNIRNKSDVGIDDYDYVPTGAHPHAVKTAGGQNYGYDANGNNTSGDGRTLHYTVFDKPSLIEKGTSFSIAFEYGPDRMRYKRTDTETGNNPTVTRYVGNVEIIDRPDGSHERKRYIAGVAIETIHFGTNDIEDYRQTHYQFRDHLGSLDVITDASGEIVQELSFDPWGQRRNAVNWQALSSGALATFDHTITTRGFTSHEMLDEVGIVHMNGRIYDPKLGRFLQADPFVQDVNNTQSFNRYSYVLNNPLNATDPSGYFLDVVGWVVAGLAAGWLGNELEIPGLTQIGAAIACPLSGGAACAAAFSFGATVGAGGSLSDAFRNGVFAGLSAAAFAKIGSTFTKASGLLEKGGVGHIAAHATTGGILSELQGGKFGHGFLSAGITKAVNVNELIPGSGTGLRIARVSAAAAIGGTVSEITGGKFANGAVTAAFAQAYNGEKLQKQAERRRAFERKVRKLVEAYKQSGLEFTQEDALLTLRAVMVGSDDYLGYIDRAGKLNRVQMDLALEAAIVISFAAEHIELLGESGLAPVKGARWTIKNAAGHDFDMEDVRENLDDNFSNFGAGGAARTAALQYLNEPRGLSKFSVAFDPRYQEM